MLSLERINEVHMMCARENPIYEQISNYSVALYILGCLEAQDFMSVEDMDMSAASEKLQEHFEKIDKKDIPSAYHIVGSKEKYLLVLGDPPFPKHFAVITDTQSKTPFFSKLWNIGSGYDNLEELLFELSGEDGVSRQEAHYFRQV